jgi:FkbM family methyltransferase
VLLNRVFGGLNYGFYVDIGAYHPVDDSVTKAFYDRGWSGINVEPGDIFEQLAAARPRDLNLHMAVFDRSGEISFAQHPGWYAGLSHVQEEGFVKTALSDGQPGVEMRTVPCDTLTNILKTHARRRPIAFLKIDAEGSEAAIIRSTDWRTIRPLIVVIEATLPLSTQLDNQDWEPILIEQGYIRAYFDGINCFYVPEERTDLLRHFELPVNVLDGFTRPEPAVLSACRDELRAVHERVQDLSAQLERAESEMKGLKERNAVLFEQNIVYANLMRTHADTVTELRRLNDEKIGALQAESEAQFNAVRTERDATRDSLESQLRQVEQRELVLAGDAKRLDRLVNELRWPDGPRALRAVLPLARTLRRLKGTQPPPARAMKTAIESPEQLALPAPGVLRGRSLARRLALLCYKPIRPFVRPLAWRTRTFLTSEMRLELAQLNGSLQHLTQLPQSPGNRTAEDFAALHAELAKFGKMLETTLLTLALESAGSCEKGKSSINIDGSKVFQHDRYSP